MKTKKKIIFLRERLSPPRIFLCDSLTRKTETSRKKAKENEEFERSVYIQTEWDISEKCVQYYYLRLLIINFNWRSSHAINSFIRWQTGMRRLAGMGVRGYEEWEGRLITAEHIHECLGDLNKITINLPWQLLLVNKPLQAPFLSIREF